MYVCKNVLCIKWLISMSHKSIRQPSASQIVNRLSVLHKFIRQSQNVGLTLIQILNEVCRKFTMARSCENIQKHPSSGVLKKSCSENMHQIYRGTPMSKCWFNKVAMQLFWNHTSTWVFVSLLHVFRTPFLKNIFGRLIWIVMDVNKINVLLLVNSTVKSVWPFLGNMH